MWDCIAGIAAMGGLGVTQPWPATAEDRFPKRGWLSAPRSVQQSDARSRSRSGAIFEATYRAWLIVKVRVWVRVALMTLPGKWNQELFAIERQRHPWS